MHPPFVEPSVVAQEETLIGLVTSHCRVIDTSVAQVNRLKSMPLRQKLSMALARSDKSPYA
jgi:hypothetical protein